MNKIEIKGINKTELKNFAISARRDLLEKVALRAKIFGIDEKNGLNIEDKFGQIAINGKTYPSTMKSAFLSLKRELENKGYEQLIEEVAYTWFNRIIAIRYMEVHDYLPERVNVLSSSSGKVEPDILSQFETMNLNVNTAEIRDFVNQGETEYAFRKLFIAQCNALNAILPFMFEKISDFTELLLPDFLLDRESILNKLVSNEALTESFTEVEVIGWLYQFYNTEPKDKVFANLKKNKKIEKYDIPAATQLFTPKWIVQYMVENSLGRLWLEGHPNNELKSNWKYYLDEAEQELEVQLQLDKIHTEYKSITPEDIKIIDPCMGSGHILVYAFEVLMQIYETAGYSQRDAVRSILEHNLYGLDIDDRAAQLAYFAVIMKARQYDRRIFSRGVQPHVYSIVESNNVDAYAIEYFINGDAKLKKALELLVIQLRDAKEYGSILNITQVDFTALYARLDEVRSDISIYREMVLDDILPLIQVSEVLAQKYDVVVTNPPYMSSSHMNPRLSAFIKNNYTDYKADFFSAFIVKCSQMVNKSGFLGFLTPYVWMFIQSYKKLREMLCSQKTIETLIQFEYSAFKEATVPVCTFTFRNNHISKKACCLKLTDFRGGMEVQRIKTLEAINFPNVDYRYSSFTKDYEKVPGYIIAFWVSEKMKDIFNNSDNISHYAQQKTRISTGDNNRFIRRWFEVNFEKMCTPYEYNKTGQKGYKWFPYNKGGSFRRWYGNNDFIINYENNGEQLKSFKRYSGADENYLFKKGLTWSSLTTGKVSFRFSNQGFISDQKGPLLYINQFEEHCFYLLGLLNSKIAQEFLNILSPTLDYIWGSIALIPTIIDEQFKIKIEKLVTKNIRLSKEDWDMEETSWGFKKHPFILLKKDFSLLAEVYVSWKDYTEQSFIELKKNEESLNEMFNNVYGLKDQLNPYVEQKDIGLKMASREQDIRSFISYAVGCLFGRYSLDVEGLAYAGGEWDDSKYKTFKPNKYGLIHLTDEQYFENDIVARLREFLSVAFSPDTVDENMQWLAESLELKKNETAEERLRRYFLDEFFKDHCQVYKKRPIYWLVDSGKQKGLRTLIYMHRYQPDTMATIRFEHLQEIQAKYNNEIAAIEARIVNPNLSATEKRGLEKRKVSYQKKLEELLEFDKELAKVANAHIAIDLDDGVKVNYAKFDTVLAKIK